MEERRVKLFSLDFILVIIAALGANFVNFSYFSAMSLFAEMLTNTVVYAGYLSFAYSMTALIMRPVCGILSDKFGRVKIIAIGALLGVTACLLYSTTTSLVLLLFIRVLHGVGMSMNQTSCGAAAPDIVPKEKLGQGIGIFSLNATVAQAVGPLIALAIVGNGDSLGDFHKLFYVSAIFCGVSLISSCFIKYERNAKKKDPVQQKPIQAAPPEETTEKTILGIKLRTYGLALVLVLYFFGAASILAFLTLYGKHRGFQLNHLGWFFLINAVGIILSRMLFGKVVDRRGGDILIIPGLILTVACLVAVPLMPSLPYLLILAFPYGLASGIVGPSINAMMFRRCPPNRRGAVSALYYASIDVGITVGAPVMGIVADHISFSWVYWMAAAVVGAAMVLFIFSVSDRRYKKKLAV